MHLPGKSLDGALEAAGAGVQLLASRTGDPAQTKNRAPGAPQPRAR